MTWSTPKTNWTSAEYFNSADLNRVEQNIDHVRTTLTGYGYSVPSITVNTGRTSSSYDQLSSINRIESNLDTIRTSFVTPIDWQSTITWTETTAFTAVQANRWENSVSTLYDLSLKVPQSFRYAGTISAGQEVLPQT